MFAPRTDIAVCGPAILPESESFASGCKTKKSGSAGAALLKIKSVYLNNLIESLSSNPLCLYLLEHAGAGR